MGNTIVEKVYKVEFIEYTNCLNDTVSDWNGHGLPKLDEINYLHVGNNGFLVRERDLEKYRKFGKGYRNISLVGIMEFPKE